MAENALVNTSDEAKVKLYWLEQSRAQRILWLLQELNVEYEIEIFHRNPKTHLAPPELKKIHALGKSPVISVTAPGSSTPVVIAESANIVEYLLDHFGKETKLLPKRYRDGQEGKVGGESEEWLRFKYFMHYAEGSLMTLMMVNVVANGIKNSPVPFFIKPVTNTVYSKIHQSFLGPNYATHFAFLENQIETSPDNGQYLCGPNLTGADILMSYPMIAAKGRSGLSKEQFPKLNAYIERIENEPGYKKSIEKIVEINGNFEAFPKI